MKKKIFIAVPNMGWLHRLVTMRLFGMMNDTRFASSLILPSHVPSENNRALITLDFLKSDADYLLMVDADNPPKRNPLDLVELDKDVIGLPTPVWHLTPEVLAKNERPYYCNVMKRAEDGWKEWPTKEGLQEVDAVGSGCILIARRVLEAVRIQPWMRVWDKSGVVIEGSDFAFCRRAKESGFKVWAHFDYQCEHYKEMGMLETIGAINGSR